MNLTEFNSLTKEWTIHLTGKDNFDLSELMELSKKNRRVRNVAMFYVYSDDSYTVKFEEMYKTDPELNNYRRFFAKALNRLLNENDESAEVARLLKTRYFSHVQTVVENSYDTSFEMAKLLKTMVNNNRLKVTPEKKAYREKLLSNVNLETLIG